MFRVLRVARRVRIRPQSAWNDPGISPVPSGAAESAGPLAVADDRQARYSRSLMMPGCGAGIALGELVELERRGAGHGELVDVGGELVLAVEHVVEGDDLAGVGGHAAHRGDQARLGAALDLVVELVLADGVDQVVPLDLVGVRLGLGERPDDVAARELLALVDAAPGRAVRVRRDDRRALGAVGVAGELLVAAVDVPAFQEQLGAVGEGVLDRVGVEVLVDVVAAVVRGRRSPWP